ncbi:hypothetical protein IFM61606_08545 [Aspergillus udagawae]|uniref:Uncharacterized protein n=1 Tax=Aspergillus udagawae TaxID=91492 RepID=A0A8H3S3B6_9EURO|nr:uncharacterized protein Aud_003412 [Aspergillus udagawae]GFF22568.1 hypothetical protein IFM61606_08545 [Aspergillus udagawae]GFF48625.1 hypothetical protein IFM51744_06875 [Aspergillus udagawae]GFF98879.1 hypothetical protein IFM53868_10019 [Aspergillus udagawae]GIC87031.1 hypothetical protein Aud_003412 [Aspergillus udagawae]
MASMISFKAIFCFAVCYLATLSSGVGLIEELKVVDENTNLRDSNVERAVVPLDSKYLPRADTVTITVTETICELPSTTLSKPSTTIWIPPVPTMATTASMPTSQTSVSTSEPSTTSSVVQTTSHRTSSTSSSGASTPLPSSSEPSYAPPLSDSANGQGKIHFALLVWSLVMTGFMNV